MSGNVDDAATQAALSALIGKISAAGAVAVKGAALIVQQAGMARTPVLSGTLRRSWKTSEGPTGSGIYSAFTGPTMVYARRIELGFKGQDSLGRTYNQAPSPYVRPAYLESLTAVKSFIAQSIARAIHL
jgi:hypothetical protein